MSVPDETSLLGLYRLICEHTRDSVYLLDDEGRIRYTNRRVLDAGGLTREDVVGEHYSVLEPYATSDNFEELARNVEEMLATDEDHERRIGSHVETPSTGRIPVDVRMVRVVADEFRGVLVTMRDVSEQRSYEEALERKTEELAVINRILRHDVRNDVSVMTGWAELLRDADDGDDADDAETLDRIVDAGQHVVELTNEVRDLMNLVEEGATAPRRPVDLRDVLTDEAAKARMLYPDAEVTVGDLPAVTVAANEMLGSVFNNLLGNAVVHNDADAPRVTVSAAVDGATVTVRVADNGPGVPDSEKRAAFGRGEHGLDSPGTGIGLYLVDRLVDGYGGSVWVTDNDPRGAVFVVELPVAAE